MKSVEEGNRSRSQKTIYRDANLQIIFGVTLMIVIGVGSITPAFPKIAKELGISYQAIGLLITVYTFPSVLLNPVLGVLADRFGRKKILVPSLMLFGIVGGACFFIRDFNLLLILRFFQGIGAASLGSLTVTIIGDLYSGKERTAAMGYNASVHKLSAASSPAIGGALAMVGWYCPFILSFTAIPVGLLVLFSLKNPEPKNEQRLKEYLSDALKSITNRQVVGLFVASSIIEIIFLGGYLTYFPLLIEHSLGASPLIIGLIMSNMPLTGVFTSSQLGKLAKVCSERTLLKASFILYALALIIMPFASNLWVLLIPTIIFGIADGVSVPSIQTLLAEMVPMKNRATFMSIDQMFYRLGGTLGPLLIGAIFGVWGMSSAFYAGAGFSIAMFMLLVLIIK